MNERFKDYLKSLTPKKRDLASEAVAEYLRGESENVNIISSARKVYDVCRDLAVEETEHAVVLLLRQNFKLIKRVKIAEGGLTETCFDIRVILREALLNNSTVIVLVHNHPSGSIIPSSIDNKLTQNAKNACDIMRIHLSDHVIIGNGAYYSYKEHGLL